MTSYSEEFGLQGFEAHDPIQESLSRWRLVGRSWSHSLIATRKSKPGAQQEMYKNYVKGEGIAYYLGAFADVARVVASNYTDIAQALTTLDDYVTTADTALVNSINTQFETEILDPLSLAAKRRIILPFIDPDGRLLRPDIDTDPLSENGALSLYKFHLDMCAQLLLEADIEPEPEPRHRTRTILGAVGVGSVLSFGYLAKRRRSS